MFDWIPAWGWWTGGTGTALLVFWAARKYLGFDWKTALALAAAVFGVSLFRGQYQKGRADGASDVRNRAEEENQDAIDRANEARRDADLRNADPDELRNDDGWRRRD